MPDEGVTRHHAVLVGQGLEIISMLQQARQQLLPLLTAHANILKSDVVTQSVPDHD